MIVATSDFNGGNTNIPNLDLVGSNLQANYIDVYEPKFLKELMGDALYAAYIATPGDARFTDLIPLLKPAIVKYVYRFYVEDNGGTFLAGTGAAKSKKQNATTESAWPLIVKAWNQMVGLCKELNGKLKDKTIYPEYTFVMPSWYWSDWYWYEGENMCIPEIYKALNGLGL